MTKLDDAQAVYILGKYRKYGARVHTKKWLENQPLVFILDILKTEERRIRTFGAWKTRVKWVKHWQNGRTGFKT